VKEKRRACSTHKGHEKTRHNFFLLKISEDKIKMEVKK
jgi:hypothetical protein